MLLCTPADLIQRYPWPPVSYPWHLRVFATFLQEDLTIEDPRHQAYMLATCKWETGNRYRPVTEVSEGQGHDYGKHDPGTDLCYCGRGYVQLTWKANYMRLTPLVGVDLVNFPELANEPKTAYAIMSIGMSEGLFTGRKLRDYFNPVTTDWLNARQIVNGLDHAAEIASYAEAFYKAIAKPADH